MLVVLAELSEAAIMMYQCTYKVLLEFAECFRQFVQGMFDW